MMNVFFATLLIASTRLVVSSVADLESSDVAAFFSPWTYDTPACIGCPSDMVLMRCSNVGLEFSDGPYTDDANNCCTKANKRSAGAQIAIQARIICALNTKVGDMKYVRSSTYTIKPTVTCPSGYTMVDCTIRTGYGEVYEGKGFPQGKIRGTSCETDMPCRNDSRCFAYAICEKS